MLKILYFASLRERMGRTGEDLPPTPGIETIADLIALLQRRDAAGAAAFAHPALVRAAVNQDFARPEAPVHDGDEIAFFPPVTGG